MRLYAACIALFLFSTLTAHANDDEDARHSLRGLKGVQVIVHDIKLEVEQNGITKSAIQTDAELKLRLAGVPIVELPLPDTCYLNIIVSTLRPSTSDDIWLYSFEVVFSQHVALARDPSLVVFAPTWSVGGFGSVGKSNFSKLRDSIKDRVDEFINAYLAVNPKK